MCEGRGSACPFPTAWSIEAIVSLDERGQILIPKEVREKVGLRPGDKLALISHTTKEGELCYFMLVPSDKIIESTREFLGPLLKDLIKE